MRGNKRFVLGVLLVVLAALPGCNSNLDDPQSAEVVLAVENVTIPPVTASLNSNVVPPVCQVTLTNATATFKDKPKNGYAISSPFNDIVLKDVIVGYVWDDGLGVTGPVMFGVGGVVPANGSVTGQFGVVNFGDLTGRFGHTATLSLTFEGVTTSGSAVSVTTGGTLAVGSCS